MVGYSPWGHKELDTTEQHKPGLLQAKITKEHPDSSNMI